MKNILVICGPTASGKTSLALNIAKKLVGAIHESPARTSSPAVAGLTPFNSVNILSADSRQVYQGLDIVTGKDIPNNIPSNIQFFGLDLANPSEVFNLSDYVNYSQKIIQESLLKNVPLIVVGGTGLYLKAITTSLLNVAVPPDDKLRKKLEKLDIPKLQKKLQKLNPEKFASLNNSDVNNPRRLIRAIEIVSALSKTSSVSRLGGTSCTLSPANGGAIQVTLSANPPIFHWIGLRQAKEVQKSGIRQRVIERLDAGASAEVKKLFKKYSDQSLPLFSSLGVKQIIEYLDKKISREELIDRWTAAEIDYARRQMVWFQKQPGIIWYDKSKANKMLAEKLAKVFKQND